MPPPLDQEVLRQKSRWLRRQTLQICRQAGEARLGSAFSATELYVALYYGDFLRFDSSKPFWPQRDRFILSKGHALGGLYPVLQDLGFLTQAEIEAICTPGGKYGPYGDCVPGLEAQWGSVGHGLGVGAGLALGAQMDAKTWLTVVMIGDGECYEGATWEAAMFASHHGLGNLIAIVDRNRACSIDFTENVLRLDPLDEKFRAFGWEVETIDGHSFAEILPAFQRARTQARTRPLCIIANTVKGKGLSQLEGNPLGHVITPSTGPDLERAIRELA